MDPQERHYNIQKLNVLFAISSVALFLALLWLFASDYSREWKGYQKEFRAYEIEKTRVKYDKEETQLEGQGEYQDLVAHLRKAQQDYAGNCGQQPGQGPREIDQLRAENDLLMQEQRFTRAKFDAARYRFEAGRAHSPEKARAGAQEFEALERRVAELDLAVERSNMRIAQQQKTAEGCARDLKDLTDRERLLTKRSKVLELKLAKIDPDKMSFPNLIADLVRNLPVIDLANPNEKIEQIVLKDITEDVNFMNVPKVDRCITCHLGIANPEYKDAPQPFTVHPNLEVFIGRDSPHPMEEFGCTVCHGGRGRGTGFVSSAHAPSDPEQAREWREKYDWRAFHHWEKPMLPSRYIQASCLKCHSGETVIKQADKLNLGLQIIEKAGCYSCHAIEKYKGWPKPGPSLTKLASKVSKDWAYRWIQDPQSFRHNTWMPAFFGQSNSSDPESLKRGQHEIHAIVEYLFKNSINYGKAVIPVSGDRARGEELVASVGCLGCHQIKPEKTDEPTTLFSLHKEHGPNLIGIGTKTSKRWLYNWLKDPAHYYSQTKMPNLRLSDGEAADITAYLATLEDAAFGAAPVPPVDKEVVGAIVFDFLNKSKGGLEASKELSAMSFDDQLQYLGKKLIRHYGCFSCHDIVGFETDKPIGTELTEEGDKPVHKLDFGFIDIDHANYAWFTQKLQDPRIFDQGRVKAHDEKLRMPNFYFTDQEIEALVTALIGFVKDKPEAKIVPRSARNLYLEDGQRIIRQLNCRGCHAIEGEGGAIQGAVKDWLMRYDKRTDPEASAVVQSFSPPNLVGEGKKVQAQWLFHFIHSPVTIRPWLKVRMPTYSFNPHELNILIKYFSALDNQEFPFEDKTDTRMSDEEYQAAEKLFSDDYFGCAKCHIVGGQLPGGSADNWAPDFALAKTRLKADWILQWIMDPQGLLPGTKMPNYFDPQSFDASGPEDILGGNEHEQIRVLRNYLLTISDVPASEKPAKADKAAAAPASPAERPSGGPQEIRLE